MYYRGLSADMWNSIGLHSFAIRASFSCVYLPEHGTRAVDFAWINDNQTDLARRYHALN